MLIYNPAFDIHHTAFRLLALISQFGSTPVEVDKLCLLDVFLSFPELIKSIRRTPEIRRAASALPKKESYGIIKGSKEIFYKMHPIQHSALNALASKGLIKMDSLEKSIVLKGAASVPQALDTELLNYIKMNQLLLVFLTQQLGQLPLNGKDGLKDRTGIMEYRYDIESP